MNNLKDNEKIIKNYNLDNIRFFILSGGKTGSSTLKSSFVNSFHCHDNYYFNTVMNIKNIKVQDLIHYSKYKFNRKPLIITSIRDPVFRAISSFFENILFHMKLDAQSILKLPIDKIICEFLKIFKILENNNCHEDIEIMGGLDIMKKEFNKEEKYSFYENDNVRVLILRFDDINNWENIIKKHLYNDELQYYNTKIKNLSSTKWYCDIYTEFKKKIKIPKEFIDYKLHLFNKNLYHFYTEEEINNLNKKYNILIEN